MKEDIQLVITQDCPEGMSFGYDYNKYVMGGGVCSLCPTEDHIMCKAAHKQLQEASVPLEPKGFQSLKDQLERVNFAKRV